MEFLSRPTLAINIGDMIETFKYNSDKFINFELEDKKPSLKFKKDE